MARTPHTDKPAEALKVQLWIDAELVEWIDNEATRRDRSRAYLVNEAVRQRMQRIERQRKPRRERDECKTDEGRPGSRT